MIGCAGVCTETLRRLRIWRKLREGMIYYADVKKRVDLHLQENFAVYDVRLKAILEEMRGYLKAGKIPTDRKGQKCSGCSMKDLCMPNIRQIKSIQSEIEKIGRTAL